MELLIVRHAVASERSAQRWPDDAARPLSARGLARARRAAAGLRRIMPRPASVLTSPLERARQTAALLAQLAAWPRAAECALLRPGASPEALLALLARQRAPTVAVIGHQPHLGRLLATCLAGSPSGRGFRLRKMGVALVSFRAAVRPGQGELVALLPPKLLRAARVLPTPR
ncbi:MAG TPA: histidine phosphatase family protein [Steroidobacteraceae bacterium]|jgi:phosphohistidine phosphatase|nr:histidine phosphatase family protein [Steroidobacteraceae bacterium]